MRSARRARRGFIPAAAIDHAVASDGSRYADLDTAFLYRKQLVAGCTCNGRDRFGLAHIDVNTDPTLRPGDIVATKTGLVAVTGMKNKVADFAPIDGDRGVTQEHARETVQRENHAAQSGAPKIDAADDVGQRPRAQ